MGTIDTLYNGYTFRTRLEARWAVFFDVIGMKYDYDVESFELNDGTIIHPNFYIHDWGPHLYKDEPEDSPMRVGSWVQIFVHEVNEEELKNATFLCSETNKPVFLIWGNVGLPKFVLKDNSYFLIDGYAMLVLMPMGKRVSIKEEDLKNLIDTELLAGVAAGDDSYLVMCDWCLQAFSGNEESLDGWPIYLQYKSIEDNQIMFSANNADRTKLRLSNGANNHVTPVYPFGFSMRVYVGKGRVFDSDFLMKAYQKARSFKFEYREVSSQVDELEKSPRMSSQSEQLIKLLQIFNERFDEEELRTLCFYLKIDYSDLPAQGRVNKARELINYIVRHNRLSELLENCARYRPDISWNL